MRHRFWISWLWLALSLPSFAQWHLIGFIPNAGQWDKTIEYGFVGSTYSVWISKDSIIFRSKQSIPASLLHFEGSNGNPTLTLALPIPADTIIAENRQPGQINFFRGSADQWVTNLPHYNQLRLVGKGIEYHLTVDNGHLRYAIQLDRAAMLTSLLFSLPEPWTVQRYADGSLRFLYQGQTIFVHTPPQCFQLDGDKKIKRDGHFRTKPQAFGFTIRDCAPDQPIYIDPLVYSTFVGTDSADKGKVILADNNGNAIVTGYTEDSNFPTTSGAYDQSYNGDNDIFVLKLNATGSALIFATFIGGSESEEPAAMAMDGSGNLYITGYTESSDFPTTSGAYDQSYNGEDDVFVLKLNSNGSALLYSTFIGGNESDYGTGIDVRSNGNAIICGHTASTNFPTTNGAYDRTHNGDEDAFVLQLNSSGSSLVYSTFLGAADDDEATDVYIRGNGMAIVCGYTESSGFPTTTNAYDQTHNGGKDWFISAFNGSGSMLVFSTFIGGSSSDEAQAIAAGPSNSIVVVGGTESSNFPTTTGAYDQSFNGDKDVAVVRLNSNASQLLFSTFIGGSSEEEAYDCFVNEGDIYLTGNTSSSNYPTSSNAYDQSYNGDGDVLVTVVDSTGSSLSYSTFLGGTAEDEGESIFVQGCAVYLTGYTYSSNFPTTTGAYDQSHNGDEDVFITKLSVGLSISISASDQTICSGESVQLQVQPQIPGAQYQWSPSTGLSSTSIPNPIATPTETITYTVTVTTPDGCSASASITITVSPSMALSTQPYEICHGDSTAIGVSVTGGTAPYSYHWSPANGLSDTSAAQPIASPSQTTTYTVTVTDAAGCSTQASVTVTVNAPPTLTLENAEICPGDSVQIGAPASGGTPLYTYSWSPASSLSDPSAAQPIAFPSQTTTYIVTVTDSKGCSTQASVTVTVNSPPTLTLQNAEICSGDSVQIGVPASGGTPPYTYSWSPASSLSDPSAAQPIAFPSQTTTYIVTVTDSKGCSYTDSLTVTILPEPEIHVEEDDLDFGTLSECDAHADTTVVIVNAGTSTVQLQEVIVNSVHFTYVAPPLPQTLEAGNRLTLRFRYNPQTSGDHQAIVRLLFGPCLLLDSLTLSGEKTDIAVALSQSSIQFPELPDCELTAMDTVITLYNRGSADITIEEPTITAPFTIIAPSFPINIPAGDSITLHIRYSPSTAGLYATAVILPFRSANCQSQLQIDLSGIVRTVAATANVDTIDFGDLLGCELSRDSIVIIENTGEMPISLTGITSTDPAFNIVSVSKSVLNPGEQSVIAVRFEPQGTGTMSGDIQITYQPCNGLITISLQGSKEGINFVAPDTLRFPQLILCEDTVISKTITLSNLSGGNIEGTITDVSISGPFQTDLTTGMQIAAGDSLVFHVTFNPPATGDFTGELTIQLQPCNVQKRIVLSGRAVDAELSASLSVVDLGTIEFGRSSTAQLSLVNTGSTTITISGLSGLELPFTILNPAPPVTLLPGESVTLHIQFEGRQSGRFTDTLWIYSDDPCEITLPIIVQGTVQQRPAVGIATCDRNFGVVIVGFSKDSSVCIRNTGQLPFRIHELEWIDNPDSVFSIVTAPPVGTELVPDQQQELIIRFSPKAARTYVGRLHVRADTGHNTRKEMFPEIAELSAIITVTGQGIEPEIQATGIDFGRVPIVHQRVDSITIRNTGVVTITVNAIEWINNPSTVFTLTAPSTLTLPPQSEQRFAVTFQPMQETAYEGSLRLVTNVGNTIEVQIRGSGVASHTMVALPRQVTITPTDQNVRIPVYLYSSAEDQEVFAMVAPVNFTATIQWNAQLFHLKDIAGATLQDLTIGPDGIAQATLFRTFSELSADTLVIGELIGDALLGSTDSSQLQFISYQWEDPAVFVRPYDGELLLTNICNQGGKRLLDFKDLFGLTIAPNPATAEHVVIHISAVEKARSILEVINSQGEVVFEYVFREDQIPSMPQGKAASLQVSLPPTLSSGMYIVRFRSPARQAVKTLMIVR